jgi:APA family basic amino acid/polyamine antiporter
LRRIVELANAGTLAAFIAVSCCVMALRVLEPARPRVFRVPFVWVLGPVAVLGCVYLFFSLPAFTQRYFLVWNVIGIVVYFLYSMHHSRLKVTPAR